MLLTLFGAKSFRQQIFQIPIKTKKSDVFSTEETTGEKYDFLSENYHFLIILTNKLARYHKKELLNMPLLSKSQGT